MFVLEAVNFTRISDMYWSVTKTSVYDKRQTSVTIDLQSIILIAYKQYLIAGEQISALKVNICCRFTLGPILYRKIVRAMWSPFNGVYIANGAVYGQFHTTDWHVPETSVFIIPI